MKTQRKATLFIEEESPNFDMEDKVILLVSNF